MMKDSIAIALSLMKTAQFVKTIFTRPDFVYTMGHER